MWGELYTVESMKQSRLAVGREEGGKDVTGELKEK